MSQQPPQREPLLELFRYGQLPKWAHRGLLLASLMAASYWLYFSIVKMELLPRLLAGETLILDAIVGFPLVLALAIVVYAVVYWATKIVFIILSPHWLTLPPDHHDPELTTFDPAETTPSDSEHKQDK